MLKSFEISNFNSIKEPIIFSMEADNELTEHTEFINENKLGDLLKVASIYGPNASGKTNLISALEFIRELVGGRLSRENPRYRRYDKNRFTPFEFTLDKNKIMVASIVFIRDSVEYFYKISAEYVNEGKPMMVIHKEIFGVRSSLEAPYDIVFSRENNIIMANQILKIIGASRLPVSNDMTLLRHLYINYISVFDETGLVKEEPKHLEYVYALYKEIRSLSVISNLSTISTQLNRLSTRERIIENKNFIIDTLNTLDIQISDIYATEPVNREFNIYCTHEINGKSFDLKVEQESQGTALLIYLLSIIAYRKNIPTIFLVDELDSHLHPKLVKEIVRLFNSKLNTSNQLIFNSHDMWNMVPENFRRDQIWYTYRNDELATELMCLSNIVNYKGERIRKDAKFSKQYMEGKYGADPFIEKGLDWYE